MHPAVAGVMIAGAVAAIMSTVDSQLLVAASAVQEDIYIRLLGGRARDRRAVWFGRVTVLALGAAALPIAWPRESVFQTVFDAWGVLAAGLGPLVILGLLTRRTNAWGALAGIVVGTVVAQGWTWVKPAFGGDVLFGNGLIPGFVLNLAVAYGVSRLTGSKGRQRAIGNRHQK
jgi:Na+/proline symporter